jgi:hypothetical protein
VGQGNGSTTTYSRDPRGTVVIVEPATALALPVIDTYRQDPEMSKARQSFIVAGVGAVLVVILWLVAGPSLATGLLGGTVAVVGSGIYYAIRDRRSAK